METAQEQRDTTMAKISLELLRDREEAKKIVSSLLPMTDTVANDVYEVYAVRCVDLLSEGAYFGEMQKLLSHISSLTDVLDDGMLKVRLLVLSDLLEERVWRMSC